MSFAFEKVHVIRRKLQQEPAALVFKIPPRLSSIEA